MEPKFVELPKLFVLGFRETMETPETNEKCPALWGRFMQKAQHLDENDDLACLGICSMIEGSTAFMYMAGYASKEKQENPTNFDELEIEACKYAVFTHKGSVMNLGNSFDFIYNEWFPNNNYEVLKNHEEFELYGGRFKHDDPDNSEVDIYIPIK